MLASCATHNGSFLFTGCAEEAGPQGNDEATSGPADNDGGGKEPPKPEVPEEDEARESLGVAGAALGGGASGLVALGPLGLLLFLLWGSP